MIEVIRAVLNGSDSSNFRPATREDVAEWLIAYSGHYGWGEVSRNLQVQPGCLEYWYVLIKSCRLPALHGTMAMNLIVPDSLSVFAVDLAHSKICRYVRRGGVLLGELDKEQHRHWSLAIPEDVLCLIPQDVKKG